jgi:hypothetical protein
MSLDALTVLNSRMAFAGAVQTTRNVATAPVPATDGMLPFLGDSIPDFDQLQAINDGSRGRSGSTSARRRSAAPTGLWRMIPYRYVMRGRPGTAYTGSIRPPREQHLSLLASGYVATFSASPTPRWIYTRYPVEQLNNSILTMDGWARAQRFRFSDVVGDFSFEAANTGEIIANPQLRGIYVEHVTAATLPAELTGALAGYDAPDLVTPVATGITLTIGDFLTVRAASTSFASNTNIGNPVVRQDAPTGLRGWVLDGFDPQLTCMVEATPLVGSPFHTASGWDLERMWQNATVVPIALQYGTAGNAIRVEIDNAQLAAAPTPQSSEGKAMFSTVWRSVDGSDRIIYL